MKTYLLKGALTGLFLWALAYPFYQNTQLSKPDIDKTNEKTAKVNQPELATWLTDYPEPVDFAKISDVKQKKLTFFSYFYPLISAHNAWILEARKFVQDYQTALNQNRQINTVSQTYLAELFGRYKIDAEQANQKQLTILIKQLLKRMDVIPPELILIQAANESGWGTSRFAREGKNYFGQWCYQAGCGLVPNQRIEGMNHEVAAYEHAYEALDSYFINMNTNPAYRILRDMRASYRKMGQVPSAEVLATGLMNYSERGADYVQDIISMIRSNQSLLTEAKMLSLQSDHES